MASRDLRRCTASSDGEGAPCSNCGKEKGEECRQQFGTSGGSWVVQGSAGREGDA